MLPPTLPSPDLSVEVEVASQRSSLSLMLPPSPLSPMDSEVDMPGAVTSDSDELNAQDDPEDFEDPDLDAFYDSDMTAPVPTPGETEFLVATIDIAEFYSPPRVLPVARSWGQRGHLSFDILTGWDFNSAALRDLSVRLLYQLSIRLVILSPPCTAFSELQRLWNFKRMTPESIRANWEQGMVFLRHSMDCAMAQVRRGAFFLFEHPARASSWRTPEVQRVLGQPGVVVVSFDQCMLGLKSKVHGMPMRKRTKIATNALVLAERFSSPRCRCNRSHVHQTIQGSEGGVRRSVWAQMYPPGMVDLLAQPIC